MHIPYLFILFLLLFHYLLDNVIILIIFLFAQVVLLNMKDFSTMDDEKLFFLVNIVKYLYLIYDKI